MPVQGFQKKNNDRRFGTVCKYCKKKIKEGTGLEGQYKNESIRFYSFKCHDNFMDNEAKK